MDTVDPYSPPQSNPEVEVQSGNLVGKPAGFWKRFLAALIDGLIVGIFGALGGGLVGGITGFIFGDLGTTTFEIIGNIIGTLIAWLYAAFLESSAKQATWGKSALGLKVTDLEGNRISFGRATGRHFAKYISMIILLIGYLMMLWTEKRQTLHDILAGCLVRDTK